MKPKVPLCHLAFLGICVAFSLVTKRVISPITNLLTDFLRIPGGSAATAFSLLFLVVGTSRLKWSWATTATSFVQSLIALGIGMSTYQGAFALVSYALPGLVIDLFRKFYPHRNMAFFTLSCAAANTAGALFSNLLTFRLEGAALLLWLLIGCVFGLFFGFLGGLVFNRLEKIPGFRRFIGC